MIALQPGRWKGNFISYFFVVFCYGVSIVSKHVVTYSFSFVSKFLSCSYYFPLCRATDSQGANESHEDLTSVLYNNTFNQVVMVKSLGLVKIYQAEVRVCKSCYCWLSCA